MFHTFFWVLKFSRKFRVLGFGSLPTLKKATSLAGSKCYSYQLHKFNTYAGTVLPKVFASYLQKVNQLIFQIGMKSFRKNTGKVELVVFALKLPKPVLLSFFLNGAKAYYREGRLKPVQTI
jgi:hypothetical protein